MRDRYIIRMNCINLRADFGDTYCITFDEAYDHKYRKRSKLDPWMMQMPAKSHGITLYPAGGDLLRIDFDRRGGLARRVAALPGAVIVQDGDHELTIQAPASLFSEIDQIVRFRRRRRMTIQQKTIKVQQMKANNAARLRTT